MSLEEIFLHLTTTDVPRSPRRREGGEEAVNVLRRGRDRREGMEVATSGSPIAYVALTIWHDHLGIFFFFAFRLVRRKRSRRRAGHDAAPHERSTSG